MVKVSSLALAGLAQASYASAAPYLFEQDGQGQTVFGAEPVSRIDKINPLKRECQVVVYEHRVDSFIIDLSAISPFFIPTEEPTPLPNETCNITSASFLIRHSSIMGNDDEFELTMQPFIWKVGNFSDDVYPTEEELKAWHVRTVRGDVGVLEEEVGVDRWAFLKDWKTSVKEETLEKLSKRGSDDAEVRPPPFLFSNKPTNPSAPQYLGKYLRKQLGYLFPPAWKGKDDPKGKHDKKLFGRKVKEDNGNGHHHHRDGDGHDVPDKNPKHKQPGPPYKVCLSASA